MPKCIELLPCDWLISNLCYQAIEQVLYLIKRPVSVYVCVLLPPCGYVLYNATRQNTTGVDQRRYGATARTFNIPTRRLYISGIFLVGQIDAKNIHFGVKCLDSTLRLILVTSSLPWSSNCYVQWVWVTECGFGHQIKKSCPRWNDASYKSFFVYGGKTNLFKSWLYELSNTLPFPFFSSMSF